MLTESDATLMWRRLFLEQTVTDQLLVQAEALVEELPLESPLRLRFATEISELRLKYPPTKPVRKSRKR